LRECNMTRFRKGIGRWEVLVWLLCAAAIGTALFEVHSMVVGPGLGQKILDILTPGGPPFSKDVITLLLAGVDERKGDPGRADTIILIWVNVAEKKAELLSVPRDTYCRVGTEETKIAHSYARGRVPEVVRAVEDLLGEPIDYYLKVNFNGIQKIVDAMGGVEMNVEERMYHRDVRGGLLINLFPGKQRLNGYQAMCYVRFRGDRDSDFGRMRRQKEFLLAAYQQLHASHTVTEIGNIAYQAWRNVDTNLSYRQLLWLSQRMGDLDVDNAKMESLPVTEGHAKEMSVLIPKLMEDREVVQRMRLLASSGFALDKRSARVQVLNGTKQKNTALLAAETLKRLGYNVVGVAPAATLDYQTSKLFAAPEAKACAEEMAKAIGVEKLFVKKTRRLSDPDIFLVVGADRAAFAAQRPAAPLSDSSGKVQAKGR